MSLRKQNDPSRIDEDRNTNLEKSLSNEAGRWFRANYLALLNWSLAVYILLPLLAPVLMKVGLPRIANKIYDAYKPLCHQLAYRSFFLFGEQMVYPRELAGLKELISYEEATGLDGEDDQAAIFFRGNQELGYKTALCQRDLAIYGSLLLFGIFFWLKKKRIKPLPWLLWIVLALIPIGLDGFSQLISQMEFPFLSWLQIRESTPLFRVLTGGMFGWFTGWFGFPSIEEMLNPPPKILSIKADER